ncbi:hypothetical protein RTM1035_07073 [Roseovarius sp. TM1035]|nr:Hypothetical protein RAK1035_2771 [Roseovarius sp. AK1035]EDM30968.1 hypothetical protein RTM1035_07073 [Roseovarius sp. TM1035]
MKSFAAQKRFFKMSSLILINAVGEYQDCSPRRCRKIGIKNGGSGG